MLQTIKKLLLGIINDIDAGNSNIAVDHTIVVSLAQTMNVRVKQGGSWVTPKKVFVKQGGTWHEASKILANSNGTWK